MGQEMKLVTRLLSIGCLILLAACSSVYSTNPVGEKPVQLDSGQWDGNWLGADGVMTIRVKDAEQGILQVAWIEDMELLQYQVQLLESGDWVFFNLREEDDDDGYFWGRIKNDGDSIILWDPDIKKFRALVTKGVLPGEVKKTGKNMEFFSDVILGELTPAHLQVITSGDQGVLFNWDEPLLLIKLND